MAFPRFLLACTAALALSVPGAEAAVTRSGFRVNPIDANRFEVEFRAGFGESDYWCAAGEYASRMRLPPAGRIWRISPPPRRQGQGVVFSFSPEGSAGRTGVMTLGGARDGSFNRTVAEQFCDSITRLRDP